MRDERFVGDGGWGRKEMGRWKKELEDVASVADGDEFS